MGEGSAFAKNGFFPQFQISGRFWCPGGSYTDPRGKRLFWKLRSCAHPLSSPTPGNLSYLQGALWDHKVVLRWSPGRGGSLLTRLLPTSPHPDLGFRLRNLGQEEERRSLQESAEEEREVGQLWGKGDSTAGGGAEEGEL